MRKILLSAVMATVALVSQAQSNDAPMATLQHGEQTLVFTGIDAFVNAYNAAADSADVIILSSGYFNAPNLIRKSISVYGAGMEDDPTTGSKATELSRDLSFQPGDIIDDDGNKVTAAVKVNGVHLEGLRINGSISPYSATDNSKIPMEKLTIAKCKFGSLNYNDGLDMNNVTVRQCVITNMINKATYNNLLVSNSYVEKINFHRNSKNVQFDHCIIKSPSYYDNGPYLCTNSILLYGPLPTGSTARCNILVGSNNLGTGIQTDSYGNWLNLANAGVWAEDGEDGTYGETKSFDLKYPTKYIGTDNTQVGLHGGLYAWNKIPSTPRIVESTIDTRTSAEGKLNISIKVEAQTKD